MVALKNMVLDVVHVPKLFKKSKIEGVSDQKMKVKAIDVDLVWP